MEAACASSVAASRCSRPASRVESATASALRSASLFRSAATRAARSSSTERSTVSTLDSIRVSTGLSTAATRCSDASPDVVNASRSSITWFCTAVQPARRASSSEARPDCSRCVSARWILSAAESAAMSFDTAPNWSSARRDAESEAEPRSVSAFSSSARRVWCACSRRASPSAASLSWSAILCICACESAALARLAVTSA
mmetsp:Transcript_26956/g.72361  ORF Transcript_26956/g.72361 Transcript_26956/m.72361 type:complete len:201 (+) Transcript_26956:1677-2279(+)